MKEIKYYGLHTSLALWKKRPWDVIRVYIDSSNLKSCARLLKGCAREQIAYHVVTNEELEKISGSVHHEGICMLAREREGRSFSELFSQMAQSRAPISLLYLDGVQNPHNMGSILRTCAHFGIPAILGKEGELPALSSSACRIAQGAAEYVEIVCLKKVKEDLHKLKKAGFSLIGTSCHEGASLYQTIIPHRALFILGSESSGMSKECHSLIDSQLHIPGTGMVESLNVSVAAALFLGEHYRQVRPSWC